MPENAHYVEKLLGGSSADSTIRLAALYNQIESVVNSYDDAFDQLPEMIQNSLDALEVVWRNHQQASQDFVPQMTVIIEEESRRISVVDNGCGVDNAHFDQVLQPNVSVKRLLGQTDARGHKGAAVTYLQFDHSEFTFATKQGSHTRSLTLRDGPGWFKALGRHVMRETEALPPDTFEETSDVNSRISSFESGSYTSVMLSEPDAQQLFDGFFATSRLGTERKKAAAQRFLYLIRTRTGLGYVGNQSSGAATVPPFFSAIQATLEIKFRDGSTRTDPIDIGFLYPHLHLPPKATFADRGQPRNNLNILYQFITPEFIQQKETLNSAVLQRARHSNVISYYQVRGYFSYVSSNTKYEEFLNSFCMFPEDDRERQDLERSLHEYLKTTGINGGFLVAVRGFPNGRLHQFIQRGGSEHKSRSFLILNFERNYVPDYGRKSLAHEVRDFTNEFCKSLMGMANSDRKGYMPGTSGNRTRPLGSDPGGSLAEAQQQLRDSEDELRERYMQPLFVSGANKTFFDSKYESEVALQFVNLINTGSLKGFSLFGLPPYLILDGLFDFSLTRGIDTEFNESHCPLGLSFSGGRDQIRRRSQWVEYKQNLDQFVSDCGSNEGDSSKKWFQTVNLLVCQKVDDQIENFILEEITADNVGQRAFFGVTHVLSATETGEGHIVQVICLEKLREIMS